MARATILFADNDVDFLEVRSEFLEQEGYLVIPATNPTEAQRKLELGGIDLAIVDIRLENDDDPKDTSGLVLAREAARSVPKIILTGFPSYEYVREALKPQLDGLPAAVDFVGKQEEPEALLAAIQRALLVSERAEVTAESLAPMARVLAQRKMWALIGAFASLVLGAGMGVVAVVTGDPRLLLGTFLFAFIMVFIIVVWVFTE